MSETSFIRISITSLLSIIMLFAFEQKWEDLFMIIFMIMVCGLVELTLLFLTRS